MSFAINATTSNANHAKELLIKHNISEMMVLAITVITSSKKVAIHAVNHNAYHAVEQIKKMPSVIFFLSQNFNYN